MIDFMVCEVIAIKVAQQDAKAEKEAAKRAEWERNAKAELENHR